MNAYVKNKETGAITKTTQSLVNNYLNTNEWELSSVSEYEKQQNIESSKDVSEQLQESEAPEPVEVERSTNKHKSKN